MSDWHALEIADIARKLGTNLESGISEEEAAARARKYGYN